jgi:hypothetical protein
MVSRYSAIPTGLGFIHHAELLLKHRAISIGAGAVGRQWEWQLQTAYSSLLSMSFVANN